MSTEITFKAAPKDWKQQKICRHCWYMHNCKSQCKGHPDIGYYTIQEMPAEKLMNYEN